MKFKKYLFEAYVHPKGGGDDYEVHGHAIAESKPVAKRLIRAHLRKLGTHVPYDDFIITGVNA